MRDLKLFLSLCSPYFLKGLTLSRKVPLCYFMLQSYRRCDVKTFFKRVFDIEIHSSNFEKIVKTIYCCSKVVEELTKSGKTSVETHFYFNKFELLKLNLLRVWNHYFVQKNAVKTQLNYFSFSVNCFLIAS